MKAVVQRVIEASVTVDGELRGRIQHGGLLVYLGVARNDSTADADWLAEKITNLRIFDDADGKMNISLHEIVKHQTNGINKDDVNSNSLPVNGDLSIKVSVPGVLVISQFTLMGDARKGRRPSWEKAAAPDKARELYLYFISKIHEQGLICETGEFQARMRISCVNDGPVTILLDTQEAIH